MNNTTNPSSNCVVLGLSGGVDSAVAARKLVADGYEVHGVFLRHGSLDESAARRAASELGISFETVDISAQLECNVMSVFNRAYREGRTPNPCVVCNPTTKFPALLAVADRIGAPFVATGHYARVIDGGLYRNPSPNDQSYMLCRLPREILRRCRFPLGDSVKSVTRADAAGLSSADAPDSMEICFIPDGDYAAWLAARGAAPQDGGEFVDTDGLVLGHHDGIVNYTVGQRRGLGVAAGERLFVKHIDPITNRITLAKQSDMYTNTVHIHTLLYLADIDPDGCELAVKLRHTRRDDKARVTLTAGGATLHFAQPVRIPAAGQFAALYRGDRLVMSGEIDD